MNKLALTILMSIIFIPLVRANPVKVISFHCENIIVRRIGSGFVLNFEGTNRVVTSDHVVFHGNKSEKICHRILLANDESYDVNLVAVNAAMGVAELSSPINLSLSQIHPARQSISAGDSILIRGFAAANENPTESSGRILQLESNRHGLPLVQEMIELDTHTEYGMSGAPVLSAGTNEVIALLSHQYLQERVGMEPSLRTIESSEKLPDLMVGLAIPIGEITQWLQEVDRNEVDSQLWMDSDSQLIGKQKVFIAGLQFEIATCSDRNRPPVERSESPPPNLILVRGGNGSGGKESEPRGPRGRRSGGDGAGIGGAANREREEASCSRLIIEQAPLAAIRRDQAWPLRETEWFDVVRRTLSSPAHSIVFEHLYQSETEDTQKMPALLMDVLQQLRNGYQPIGYIVNPFVEGQQINKVLEEKLARLEELAGGIDFTNYEGIDSDLFKHRLETILLLPRSGQFSFIGISQSTFDEIFNSDFWHVLFLDSDLDPIKIAEMRSLVGQVRDLLAQIRLNP